MKKRTFIALFAIHLCLFDQCHDNVIQVFNVSTTLSMSISLFLHQKLNTFYNIFCLKNCLKKPVEYRSSLERKNEKKNEGKKGKILLNVHIAVKRHEQSGMSFAVICSYKHAK